MLYSVEEKKCENHWQAVWTLKGPGLIKKGWNRLRSYF